MEALPDHEARLLAVYFEESAAYQAELMDKSRTNANASSPGNFETYEEIGDFDTPDAWEVEDDDYGWDR